MSTTTTTSQTDTTPTSSRLVQVAAFLLIVLAVLTTSGYRPAHARGAVSAPSVTALDDPVEAGDFVDVIGDGFQPGEYVDIEFGGWTIASAVAESDGSFFTFGLVDHLMPAGAHPLDAIGDLGSWATTDLTVIEPPVGAPIQRYPYVGALQITVEPGGAVDVIGGDFEPFEYVTVEFGGVVIDAVPADANGEFYAAGWIDPLMPDGFHPLDAWGDLGSSATSDLEVHSLSGIDPVLFSWGPVPQGTYAVVEGDGFSPFETVWIDFGGLSTPATADDWGYFVADVFVPADMPVGDHPLDAWGDTGAFATTDQFVDPAVASPVTQASTPQQAPSQAAPKQTAPTQTGSKVPSRPSTPQTPKASDETRQPTDAGGDADDTNEVDGDATSDVERVAEVDKVSDEVQVEMDGEVSLETVSDDASDVASDDVSAEVDETDDSADADTETRVVVDDDGVSILGAGIAGILLAGATAGAAAMVGRRRR